MTAKVPPQEPIVFPTSAASIGEETQALINKLRQVHDDVVKNVTVETATFDNVILPLVREENERYSRSGVLRFFCGISPNKSLRYASEESKKQLQAAVADADTRCDVFALVDAVRNKQEDLDPESQRLLDQLHREYTNGGGNLQGPDRERFLEIRSRIKELIETFEKNQDRAEKHIVYKAEDLDGVSSDLVDRLNSGRVETPDRFGVLNTREAYNKILRWAPKEETRKRQYMAFNARCPENVPVFKEIMVLRDESARLLGYANHADLSVQNSMAGSVKAANTFLDEMRAKLLPAARKEMQELRKMKMVHRQEKELQPTDKFYEWEREFYYTMLLNRDFPANGRLIAHYFPLEWTMPAILRLFEHLFGISFQEIEDASKITWADGVKVYHVWDDEGEGGAFLGYMYLDLLPREGKRDTGYYRRIQPGFIREDGTRHYSSAVVRYTIEPHPVKGLSALLDHSQVEMLAHQVAHVVHDLVSRTRFARFHGSSGSMDFSEAPGQIMEYFCWNLSIVQGLSTHYAYLSEREFKHYTARARGDQILPARKIPPALVADLVRRDEAKRTLLWVDQLFEAEFDQRVHQPGRRERVVGTDFDELFEKVRREGLPGVDWEDEEEATRKSHRGSNYGQILKEYYDAQQYHYIFTQVIAADIWYSRFRHNPLDAKEGRSLRYEVLEKGAAVDEMELITRYLGREISREAFFEDLGISATSRPYEE